MEPKQKFDVMRDDPADNRILECTVADGSDYIVTGDNHLLKLGQFALQASSPRLPSSKSSSSSEGVRACVRTANFRTRGGSPRIYAGEGALQRSGKYCDQNLSGL